MTQKQDEQRKPIKRAMDQDVQIANARKTFKHKQGQRIAIVKDRQVAQGRLMRGSMRTRGKQLAQSRDEIADYLARNPPKVW